jgi:glycosyltransferase involved in cell wall biosynthesis
MASLAIKGGALPLNVYLSPNGVDQVEIGLSQDMPVVSGQNLLFIGRLEYNKGIDILVESFCNLSPIFPELTLTCIGASDASYLRSLKQCLHRFKAHDRVIFLSPQPRTSLGYYYCKSSLVIVPSRSETQSTVAMEAMAAGRPVLASNTGGNTMLVDVPNTGLLFRSGDSTDLALKIQELMNSPSTLARMGFYALERHKLHFTRERCAEVFRKNINLISNSSRTQEASIIAK